jgi:anti-sigma-K factor RskA
MTHEDYKDLLAAHALTALDAAEAGALAAHLESCAECRAEFSAWEATTALLALDAEPLEPSAHVRASILASVAEDRAGVASRSSRAVEVDRAATMDQPRDSASRPADDSKVLTFERPRKRVWVSLGPVGAIAATLVSAVLIILLLALWQQNRTMQREWGLLPQEIQAVQAQLNHERAVVELLTSPDAHMAKLSGTNMAPGARAILAFDKSGHAMLMTNGLPAAPAGMAYQLWFIKDNKKMPGKVFTLDDAGNGMLEDQVPDVAREAAVFAVTLEPASGVPAPTGSIYLVSS